MYKFFEYRKEFLLFFNYIFIIVLTHIWLRELYEYFYKIFNNFDLIDVLRF